MCGRFMTRTDAAMARAWQLRRPPPTFASYNVTPSTRVPIVRLAEDGAREAVLMRWGMIPSWAQGATTKYATINATAERMKTAPVYRGPWKRGQRCLFPVSGFYEWQAITGRPTKQPWFIRVADQDLFALGGLWESSRREDGTVIESCTIVTLPANELLAEIHNTKKRMPLILPRDAYEGWLGTQNDAAEAFIQPYPSSRLEAWPVSTYVNSPKHDDPRCCSPL
jgi:putative SOS response-associated peptidase YedK